MPGKKIGFFIIVSFILLIPNFIRVHLTYLPERGHTWEQFEPALVSDVNNIDQLLAKADSVAKVERIEPSSLEYVVALNTLIKKRFYHGYSYYSLEENWIAAVLGKTAWSHLSAIVLPDDILKYPMAACSQQSIVLMECLKRRGIDYRKVGFDHHFALEAQLKGQWYFFDPDMEPDFTQVTRSDIVSLLKDNALYTLYQERLDSAGIEEGLANQFYGTINEHPAPRAFFFHRFTKVASKIAFLIPLLALVYLLKRGNKRTKIAEMNKPAVP